jgi:uncharacterized protein (DUF697 family)
MSDDPRASDSKALHLVRGIVSHAIDGVPPMSSAFALASEYKSDASYESADARVDALIRWEAAKNFGSGFLTGLGGVVTLPVSVPAGLGASWILQARLCGAIADIYGHSLGEDRVRTLVLLALIGDSAKEALKDVGVAMGKQASLAAINRIPGKTLMEINKKVGFRLLTKAGETGIINLTKIVPVLGGAVGGSFDAAMCVAVGKTAKKTFRPD